MTLTDSTTRARWGSERACAICGGSVQTAIQPGRIPTTFDAGTWNRHGHRIAWCPCGEPVTILPGRTLDVATDEPHACGDGAIPRPRSITIRVEHVYPERTRQTVAVAQAARLAAPVLPGASLVDLLVGDDGAP